METTVGTKKKKDSPLEIRTSRPEKRLPMGKMAADEEEEKISSIRFGWKINVTMLSLI